MSQGLQQPPIVRDIGDAPAALDAGREAALAAAESSPSATRVFTEFVRSAGATDEVDRTRLPAVLPALGIALRSELRRRGLWESPPSYLGICGWDSWISASPHRRGGPGRPFGGGAFDELLAECYTYIFVDRLRSLQAQLAAKPNVDGLVFLNIRHFLHERQREIDPLGFRVFEVVGSAVNSCLAAGVLHVVQGDPKVRNDSVLAFDPAADPSRADGAGLDTWISQVDDELLPGLVTARGKRLDEVIARLAERLPELRRQGIAVFRFKDLVNPCKDDVRARWSAMLGDEEGLKVEGAQSPGAGAGNAWIERPDKAYEDRESFRTLVASMPAALQSYQTTRENRLYLATLWQYLRRYSAGETEPEAPLLQTAPAAPLRRTAQTGQTAPAAPAASTASHRRRRSHPGRPSDRTLADLLKIPRRQLPQLFAALGSMVEACRGTGAKKAPATPGAGRRAPLRRPALPRLTEDCRRSGAGALPHLTEDCRRPAGGRIKKGKEERAPGTSPN
jgi:hypothetical protein